MPTRRFIQCDVFTPAPTQGNALAVVLDGDDLSDAQMQQFAAWTNLAETTFLTTPTDATADYGVRIFTPAREMPFAGHPTLGSCAAWLHSGGRPAQNGVVRQQCQIGLIEIDLQAANRLAFVAPPTDIAPMSDDKRTAIVSALSLSDRQIRRSAELTNGPVWQAFELDNAESVLALDAQAVRWPQFQGIGFIGAHAADSPVDYEVRMLAPSSGMSEDPITGSLNAALAHWLHADNRLTGAVQVAQGTRMNRRGQVCIVPDADGSRLWIGGQTHILIEGTVQL